MARSPTGTFTLVAGNPVITGTIITSDWANTTMPDIGAALTDSLSRTGQGGMLAPIRGVSGSATAPAHSFTDFPRSGMYAVSANEMRYAVNGVDRMRWQAGGLPTQTYNVATGLWEDLEPVGVVGPNLLDNSNFQIHQRGVNDGGGTGVNATYIDRYSVRGSNGTGGTVQTSLVTLNSGGLPYNVFRVGVTGNTAPVYIRQNFKTERLKGNTDYTFTLRTNLMDTPIKMKAKLRGRDVSAGAWAELGEGDLELDSYGTYSVTFLDVDSSLPLTEDADYIQIELTGVGADNGSDFVLPDGAYRWEWFKLEEGNTFTGYEPTPYAIDEAECMKWLYPMLKVGSNLGARMSAGQCFTGVLADVLVDYSMYFTPSLIFSQVSHFAVYNAGGSPLTTTGLAITSSSTAIGGSVQAIVASGLSAGNAAILQGRSTSAFMYLTCEL